MGTKRDFKAGAEWQQNKQEDNPIAWRTATELPEPDNEESEAYGSPISKSVLVFYSYENGRYFDHGCASYDYSGGGGWLEGESVLAEDITVLAWCPLCLPSFFKP